VVFLVQLKSVGQVLLNAVIHKLQLVESDYFDLEFTDHESIPVSLFTIPVIVTVGIVCWY